MDQISTIEMGTKTREELENMHVLFMQDDRDGYIDKLFAKLRGMVE